MVAQEFFGLKGHRYGVLRFALGVHQDNLVFVAADSAYVAPDVGMLSLQCIENKSLKENNA